MIKEFANEAQAKALAESLGLFITKKNGVFIVGNTKEAICRKYNMGFWDEDEIFYDNRFFKVIEYGENKGELRIRNQKIKDARNIELPYGIKYGGSLFSGCLKLKYPPKIPASMTDCGYMFRECVNLKEVPKFPPKSDYSCALARTPLHPTNPCSKGRVLQEKREEQSLATLPLICIGGIALCVIAVIVFVILSIFGVNIELLLAEWGDEAMQIFVVLFYGALLFFALRLF